MAEKSTFLSEWEPIIKEQGEKMARRCHQCRNQGQLRCPYGMAGLGITEKNPKLARDCSSFRPRPTKEEK